MKKTLSIILVIALMATLCLSLISCVGEEEQETENKIIVGGTELDDENETVKQPASTGETQDWGLGEVPLDPQN